MSVPTLCTFVQAILSSRTLAPIYRRARKHGLTARISDVDGLLAHLGTRGVYTSEGHLGCQSRIDRNLDLGVHGRNAVGRIDLVGFDMIPLLMSARDS